MAKLNIDIKVEDKSVGKSVEKVQSLKTQIRELQKQIQTAKVGSKEFEELSERLKDTKDQFDLVNAKSGDLFDSFNKLPGPIGMIGSAVQGTLDDLKILSSFNIKDLGKQFGAIGDDISLIGGNLAKTTGITKLFNATTLLTSNALKAVGVSASVSSKGIKLFSAALIATGIGAIVVALGLLIANFDKVRDSLFKLIPGLKTAADFVGNLVNKFTDLIGITNEAERAEKKRQETYDKAKKSTDIVNDGLQREIDLLKARGATQEEIDKKRKQIIQNELNDLKKLADENGKFNDENAKKYKDLQNQLAVIDAEAETRKREASKKAAEDAKNKADKAAQEAKARREKLAQEEKQFLEAQADAVVQIEKDKEDTNAETLRQALQKQFDLRNEGKRISAEVAKAQADEIEKIVQEEVNKDLEARQKAFEEKVKLVNEENKLVISQLQATFNVQKAIYGETSKEAQKAQDDIFRAQQKALDDERTLLETKKELTNEEKIRIQEIGIEQLNLTATIKETENQRLQITKDAVEKERELRLKAFNDQVNILNLQNESLNVLQQDYWANRLSVLDIQQKLELDGVEKGSAQELAILKKYAKLKEDLKNQEASAYGAAASATLDSISALGNALASSYDEEAKTSKDAFEKRKKLQKTTALISAASGLIQILTQPSVLPSPADFIVKTANAVTLGIATASQIAKIDSTQFEGGGASATPRRLASGGMIKGAGGGKSDLIPAMLSNGESVINAKSTSLFRPLLSSINELGGGKKFAEGGLAVSSFSQEQALSKLSQQVNVATQPIKTYVVASDMTNQQMFDRMAKNRSTL
jgi:hypothetical protein